MYHYIIRAMHFWLSGEWDKMTVYPNYVLFQSSPFETLEEMIKSYERTISEYHIEPNPIFFCDNEYMKYPDEHFYSDITIGEPFYQDKSYCLKPYFVEQDD